MSLITLTTDFGLEDWFVGAMKGVILGVAPRAGIVDITHEIFGGDVFAGAFALAASYRYFPRRTVHVAVIDPGVGGYRQAIAVQTRDYFFVGPDNGVLSLALERELIRTVRRLENERLFRPEISSTFHGRDIFAPVAARLSKGAAVSAFGPARKEYVRLSIRTPEWNGERLIGEVIYVDRFGNAITNIREVDLIALDPRTVRLGISRRKRVIRMGRSYPSVPPGQPVAVLGSAGFLEIAINRGRADKVLALGVGSRIVCAG